MTSFQKERLACAYFFAVPGLIYGIFTSRLPAFKEMTGADDGKIGILLLIFGLASLAGLLTSDRLMRRFRIKRVMGFTAILFAVGITCASLAFSFAYLMGWCILAGYAGGLCEVAMNAQGIAIEKRYNALCMASLHACFSLGGVAGSLSGSLFAAYMPLPIYNFIIICLFYFLFWPFAYHEIADSPQEEKKDAKSGKRLPLFIYLCGFMSMLCYISEGSVGDWGSILLHSTKGAPQSQAALVFGCFCVTMVIFRFFGDRLRQIFGDFKIVLFGALLGAGCMTTVLLSASIPVCLLAYAVMGMGFAPIVPILFSRAGQYPGVSASRASAAISILSYSGLLVFSPLVGTLGDIIGLGRAFWLVPAACLLVAAGSPLLLRRRRA